MNTLDEVIKVFETGMLFSDKPFDEAFREFNSDALHYLKEYKNTDEKYKKAIAHVTEVVDYYEKMVADYQAVNNPPLTWDELKSMVGKPVWVNCAAKRWIVIADFRENGNGAEYFEATDGGLFSAKTQSDLWQAYRKEGDASSVWCFLDQA